MNKIVRNIREPLKKPRPLKSLSVDQSKDSMNTKAGADLLSELEALNIRISNWDSTEVLSIDVSHIYSILKNHGEELESSHKDALDRYFCTLRNVSREDRLDVLPRLKLLEIIELRAMHWEMNENLANYFSSRYFQLEGSGETHFSGSVSPSVFGDIHNQNLNNLSGMSLAPGELLKSSGKFNRPTKIAGKNYFKDEIVIRNCDSGKVNAGARDRLVQITGPHEDAISHAKFLVEDTIKRNVSPIRDTVSESLDNKDSLESYFDRNSQASNIRNLVHSFSMSDASSKETSISLEIGHDVITISGKNPELLKTAKKVLMEYFFSPVSVMDKDSMLPLMKSVSSGTNERYQLKKQISLKENMGGLCSLTEQPFSRRSSSSASWSSDEILEKDMGLDVPIPPPCIPSRHTYSREFLLEYAQHPLSQKCPSGYDSFLPDIKAQSPTVFDPSPYLQKQNKSH